jgi:hypothetical protein
MVRGDSLNYAHAAYELSLVSSDLGDWDGVSRVGMYAPVALLYALLGPSQFTTLLFPFISSLATVIFIFLIGKMLGEDKVGLIAALLWAFFPLDIFLATSLLPDVPVSALSTAGMYFLIREIRIGHSWNWNYTLAAGLFIAAILVKPIAIISAIAAVALIIDSSRPKLVSLWKRVSQRLPERAKVLIISVGAIGLISAIIYYAIIQPYAASVTLAKTSTDLIAFFITGFTELDISGRRIEFSSLLIFFAPLFLISFVWAISNERDKTRQLLVWLAVVFLYYEWGTINLKPLFYVPLQPFNEARNFLFIMPPIFVMVAIYLAQLFSHKSTGAIIAGISFFATLVAWVIRDIGSDNNIHPWLAGVSLFVLLLSIGTISIFMSSSIPKKLIFGSLLLLGISLASLHPATPYHFSWYAERAERLEMLEQALEIFPDNSQKSIVINGNGNAMSLNYISNFELGFDWVKSGQTTNQRIHTAVPVGSGGYYHLSFDGNPIEGKGQLRVVIEGNLGNTLVIREIP